MNKTINISDYYIDIDKLMQWVSTSLGSERNVMTSITQIYPIVDDEEVENSIEEDTLLNMSTKEVTETKSSLNDTMNNIRYDIVKILINTLLYSPESNDTTLTPQQWLCFNTLLEKEIIKMKIK